MLETFLQIIVPLITLAGVLVAIVLHYTKDNSKQDIAISVLAIKNEEQIKTVFASLERIEKHLSNHIAHQDTRMDTIAECIQRMDKELFAHLKTHENQK